MFLEDMERHHGSLSKRTWQRVAFLGRYGHQPADLVLSMAVPDVTRLVNEVAAIVEAENKSLRSEED